MIQRKFRIKDGILLRITEERIEDYSKLLKYNPNLKLLAEDIRRSRKDEHFENYLLKAEELFAEDIEKAKVVKDPVFGNHSVFYYMYGHMNDWVRYAEKQVIEAKALLTVVEQIDETVKIIRYSRNQNDAAETLVNVLGLDAIGAKCVVDHRLSQLTGMRPDNLKEFIEYSKKQFATLKELAKYDKKNT